MLTDLVFTTKHLTPEQLAVLSDVDLSDGGLRYVITYNGVRYPHTCCTRLQVGVYRSFTLSSHLPEWTDVEEINTHGIRRQKMEAIENASGILYDKAREDYLVECRKVYYGVADNLSQVLSHGKQFIDSRDLFVLMIREAEFGHKDGPYLGTEKCSDNEIKLKFNWIPIQYKDYP